MKAVVDRIVQYPNRYKLTNAETGEVLGTFDFEEVTGTVQQVGTEIDKELFDSIANDLAARVKLSGGELAGTIVTFSDISGTAANVASGDTSATLWGKVKNWFSRLKALAFKNKVAAGDFEAGAIKNADVAADAAIAQSKVSGLMTDYVASISVSGRTVTYKNKNGVNMGSITTQDTTYGLASQSSNGLMSSTDKTKLDGIESGAQKNTVLGVKGSSESAYRTGNVNITKANIGLGNVDNTSDEDKPVSTATQTALNGKANTSGTYPNLTVGKATNADNVTNATNATNLIPDENGAVNPGGRGSGTVGDSSTAIGSGARASGTRSTALGYNSAAKNSNAIALGNNSIAMSIYSTALGYNANALSRYSTALGQNANISSTEEYTMQLGSSTLSALRCKVNLTVTSDKRDKTDIEGITDALAFIERLNPVTFVSNDRVEYISDEDKKGETFRTYGMCEYDRIAHAAGTKKGERRRCGLLAQEVVEAMQSVYGTDNYANVVNDNFHDLAQKPSDVENKYTLAYANLVPFLIGAIKELNAKIKALDEGKTVTSSVAGVQED